MGYSDYVIGMRKFGLEREARELSDAIGAAPVAPVMTQYEVDQARRDPRADLSVIDREQSLIDGWRAYHAAQRGRLARFAALVERHCPEMALLMRIDSLAHDARP